MRLGSKQSGGSILRNSEFQAGFFSAGYHAIGFLRMTNGDDGVRPFFPRMPIAFLIFGLFASQQRQNDETGAETHAVRCQQNVPALPAGHHSAGQLPRSRADNYGGCCPMKKAVFSPVFSHSARPSMDLLVIFSGSTRQFSPCEHLERRTQRTYRGHSVQ